MRTNSASKERLSEAYGRYSDMLYRIAVSQLGGCDEAMDAVHDVFLRFIDSEPSFSDSEHEKAWFIRALINRCHDILRHKKVRNHLSIDEIHHLAGDDSKSEALLSLDTALASIPEKYRIAVTLHYLEGFSVEEISSILRIGVSAVKMRLSRGREALKDKLEKEENNV